MIVMDSRPHLTHHACNIANPASPRLASPRRTVQVVSNMVDFGMDPQEALDAARFCVAPVRTLRLGSG
jgi:hypothetical protein